MKIDKELINDVSKLAIKISQDVLLVNFSRVVAENKQDGSWLTVADTQAHKMFIEGLPEIVDVPVLSEEMSAIEQQAILDNEPLNYWCIDPLDGTSNFTKGIPYWCTSIALIIEGKIELGVIYDANRDECFAAAGTIATTLNGVVLEIEHSVDSTDLKSMMGLIDFKRLDKTIAVSIVRDQPYRSQRSFGASALDFCWIAAQRCQIYLHGQQNLWDHAAGLLILENAGGKAETLSGEQLYQNSLEPKSVIAACNLNAFTVWKEYIQNLIHSAEE